MTTPLQNLAPNLWFLAYPLKTLGVDLHRNVTIIRLASGKLIIHSTAPFSPEDIDAIQMLGQPGWLIDTLLRHDTFTKEGRAAFPGVLYLAPDGFTEAHEPLLPPPAAWADEISVLAVQGAPDFGEVVLLHRASRTLIVADLVFNFVHPHGLWTNLLLDLATVGSKHDPGVTKPFKMAIKDRATFSASVREILTWDFDRIIVGHGSPIPSGGKEMLREALTRAGVADL